MNSPVLVLKLYEADVDVDGRIDEPVESYNVKESN